VKSLIEYVVERFEEDLKQSGQTQVLQVRTVLLSLLILLTHTHTHAHSHMHASVLYYAAKYYQ
jgi:hypothetical protein